MTVSELIQALQRIEAAGDGELPVVYHWRGGEQFEIDELEYDEPYPQVANSPRAVISVR